MITQSVIFSSKLSLEEVEKVAKNRAPQFRAVKGLVQKYYIDLGQGRYSGFYIWENEEALANFRASDLAKTIPAAYQIEGAPEVVMGNCLFPLRELAHAG